VTATASNPSGHEPAAPLSAGDASARPTLESEPLLALTRDAQLLETLRRVGDPAHEVCPAASEVDLAAALLTHHAGVAVLDCAAIGSPVAQLTQRLSAQFPELALIVAGGIEEQTQLAAQIADGSVHRFLHKPLSEQRVRLFVEAAWRRHAEMRAHPFPGGHAAAPAGGQRRRRGWWLALPALAALATPFVWIGTYPPQHAPEGTPGVAPVKPVGARHEDRELESLLERAEKSLSAGSLTTPAGASAADLYKEALRRNPRDPRALNGLEQVIGRLLGSAEVQLQQWHLDAAQALAEEARAIDPHHPRVAFLLAEVNTARERAVLEKAQRAAAGGNVSGALAVLDEAVRGKRRSTLVNEAREAAQQQLDAHVGDLLARARDALSHAQLISPAEDNARFYIESAHTLAPTDARVEEATQDLIARLESEARQALAAKDADAAESWITAAAATGADPEQVATMRQRVEELRSATSAESAQLARAAYGKRALDEAHAALEKGDLPGAEHWLGEARAAGAESGSLGALESDLHAAASAARQSDVETYVNESTLTRTRYVAPEFPEEAELRGIVGWVDLHFVVNTDGAVSALTVVGAHPAGIFERSAIAAVSKWRYQPVRRGGEPVSQHAQVRLRFELPR
jgi:periplasmic protein TonB